MIRRNRVSQFVAVAAIVALMPVLGQAQTNIKPGFNLFSPDQDVQIGQASAAQAEQQMPILRDAQVEAYVSRIGQRLAANAGGPKFQYQFHVVNAPDINAFALPGGFVYINRGVIDNARNEGELAGVMAHEISHVALRHGTHQASKAYLTQAGIGILGGILGGKVGSNATQIINQVGGLGLNVLFLKFSRDLESQADLRGSQILAASGYSPADMVSFFQTLEKVDASKKTNFLSDHPAPPDRIARIQKEAQLLKVSNTPTTNVAELRQIQQRLGGVGAASSTQVARTGPATSPSTSRTRPSATSKTVSVPAPASSLKSFTAKSGLYRVSYPSNWAVYDQGTNSVTLAPQGGAVNVGGRTEIVYGAIINHYDPFNSGGQMNLQGAPAGNATLENATNDLIGQIQQSSSYLRLVQGSGQRTSMAGGQALAAMLTGTNPNTGVQESLTVVTRQLGDEHLVYMLFVTPEKDAARYQPVLQAMVNSMQINANPAH
jgi:Zn-dependent protease with chaperone function